MIQVKNTHIPGDIQRIERKYNPENDTIPGAPAVTWTDSQLLELNKALFKMVEDLQEQIKDLSATVDGIYFREGRRLS